MLGIGTREGEKQRKKDVGELHCGWLMCLIVGYRVVVVDVFKRMTVMLGSMNVADARPSRLASV